MKKSEVKVGQVYVAKVSDRLVSVRIDSVHSRQGWNATNTKTGRRVHIKSAQRLRGPAKAGTQKLAAVAKADQENARLRDERAKAPDGMTASERAMARSAKKMKVTKTDAKEAVAAVVANDAKAAKAAATKLPAKAAKAPPAKKTAKPKRISALDAAAAVLREADKSMHSAEIIDAMAEQGLWTSPNGKTPHATLYAAMLREIGAKGDAARFRKVDRGQFAFNAEAK